MIPAGPESNVKSMRRLMFGLVASLGVAARAAAQPVPGRDLLMAPIGTLGAPVTLGTLPGHSFWNPAAGLLPARFRAQATVAAVNSPSDLALSAHLLTVTGRVNDLTSFTIGVIEARVGDMLRTETDPQSLGRELRYATTVVSAGMSRRGDRTQVGMALRWRRGEAAGDVRQNVGVDAGVILTELGFRDLRFGASTFLWAPGQATVTQARYGAAADLVLAGGDTLHQVRGGFEIAGGTGLPREYHLFASARWRRYVAHAGYLHERLYGFGTAHYRGGIGLRYARYFVGVGREDDQSGIGPTYQFTLSAAFQ